MANKLYLETQKNVGEFGRLFNSGAKANLPIPEDGGGVYLEGTSLVIPEQPAPEPVITIDGVAYFHKHEFDLEEMPADGSMYDVLTGEQIHSGRVGIMKTALMLNYSPSTMLNFSTYTSREFTVIDDISEFVDDTTILLPTCSAYYGFLSEDKKTFISYYNLKSDGAPEKVDSIKQGDATIPLAISSGSATEGQVLTADGDGNVAWQEAMGFDRLDIIDQGYRQVVHGSDLSYNTSYLLKLNNSTFGFMFIGKNIGGSNAYATTIFNRGIYYGIIDLSSEYVSIPSGNAPRFGNSYVHHVTITTAEGVDECTAYFTDVNNDSLSFSETEQTISSLKMTPATGFAYLNGTKTQIIAVKGKMIGETTYIVFVSVDGTETQINYANMSIGDTISTL